MTKTCNKCNLEQELNNFDFRKDRNYYYSQCKNCMRQYRKEWELENKERRNKRKREIYPANQKEKQKKRYENNKQKHAELTREYYINNKEKILKNQKIRLSNPDTREKLNIWQRKYYKKRIENPQYKIRNNLSKRLRDKLKKENPKNTSILNLIGCSIKELKIYLESKFIENMSWDNYGVYGWHIDHIIPCEAFDLTKEEEQRKCFHYSNLQPLWAKDNISKNDKLPDGRRARDL